MMTRIALALALVLGLAVSTLGPLSRGAGAVEIIGPTGKPIMLEAQQGRLIRLDRPAATVFVADSGVADVQVKSPKLIYLFGRRAGSTTIFVVDDKENVLMSRTVTVTHNLVQLRRALKGLMPKEAIEVQSVNGAIVMTGTVSSAAAVEDARNLAARFAGGADSVINKLGIDRPQQINLRVRIAEITRQTVKQLGINWDVLARDGNFVLALATGIPAVGATPTFFPIAGFGAAGSAFNTRNIAPLGTSNSIATNFNQGVVDVNSVIDALESEGLIKIMAEPNLSALSGQTASFLAGGEFPIPVPGENGTITIAFRKFGISLSFTPTIVGENRINIRVAPEVSQLSTAGAVNFNGFVIPSLTIRRAETTVELGSGQSFAIAGLLQNNTNYDVRKFPWLGDIPILGKLFRSDTFQRNETELLIIVTPYIVKPINTRQIVSASPKRETGATLPTLGTAGSRKPPLPAAGGPKLHGPAGFRLE